MRARFCIRAQRMVPNALHTVEKSYARNKKEKSRTEKMWKMNFIIKFVFVVAFFFLLFFAPLVRACIIFASLQWTMSFDIVCPCVRCNRELNGARWIDYTPRRKPAEWIWCVCVLWHLCLWSPQSEQKYAPPRRCSMTECTYFLFIGEVIKMSVSLPAPNALLHFWFYIFFSSSHFSIPVPAAASPRSPSLCNAEQ